MSYHLRLTTDMDFDKIEEFVQKISSKYLLCQEEGHYHAVVLLMLKTKEVREMIKIDLGLKGNACYSLKEAQSLNDLCQYVCKQGNVRYLGYTFIEVNAFKKLAYKKDGMKEVLKKLEMDYVSDNLSDREFGEAYIKLLVEHDKNLHGNQIKAYLLKMRVKKNPNSSREIYENFMRFI